MGENGILKTGFVETTMIYTHVLNGRAGQSEVRRMRFEVLGRVSRCCYTAGKGGL
jgi:hypothetical protein